MTRLDEEAHSHEQEAEEEYMLANPWDSPTRDNFRKDLEEVMGRAELERINTMNLAYAYLQGWEE